MASSMIASGAAQAPTGQLQWVEQHWHQASGCIVWAAQAGSCPSRVLICGSTAPAFTIVQCGASQECRTVQWAASSLRLQGPCTGHSRSTLSHAWPHATAPHQTDTGAPVLARPAQVPRHADGLVRCVQDGGPLATAAVARSAAAASMLGAQCPWRPQSACLELRLVSPLAAKVQVDVHRGVKGRVARIHAAARAVGHCAGGGAGGGGTVGELGAGRGAQLNGQQYQAAGMPAQQWGTRLGPAAAQRAAGPCSL